VRYGDRPLRYVWARARVDIASRPWYCPDLSFICALAAVLLLACQRISEVRSGDILKYRGVILWCPLMPTALLWSNQMKFVLKHIRNDKEQVALPSQRGRAMLRVCQ